MVIFLKESFILLRDRSLMEILGHKVVAGMIRVIIVNQIHQEVEEALKDDLVEVVVLRLTQ